MIIWIASYPRSGNTLVRTLLNHYYGIPTYTVYEDLDTDEWKTMSRITGAKHKPAPIDAMRKSSELYFVKTHELPDSDDPAVYIVRDGRDALVSYAHYRLSFEQKKTYAKNEFETALKECIESEDYFGGWSNHILAWISAPNVKCVMKYEELSLEPLANIQAIMDALEVSITLRTHDPPPAFEKLHSALPAFFRKGQARAWRDELSEPLQALFWDHHGAVMDRLNYER